MSRSGSGPQPILKVQQIATAEGRGRCLRPYPMAARGGAENALASFAAVSSRLADCI